MTNKYMIYSNTADSPITNDTNDIILDNFLIFEWKASFMKFRPEGIKFSWLWVLYYFWFLFDKNYEGLLLFDINKKLVHSLFLIPNYFRFPFMEKNSLQVSNVWTSKECRNTGVATAALKFIIKKKNSKKIWFLCREDNLASARIAEKAGLTYKRLCVKKYIWFFSFYQ